MTVFYACFYCKKNFYLKKERLKTHWVIGCPKNKLCCTSRCCLSLKTTREETSQPLHTKGRGVECSCLSVEGCPPPVPSVRLLTRTRPDTRVGSRSCTVYLTPANVEIHVESKLLGALTFPAMTHYFRSKDNWNTVKQYEDANDPSSDED